MKKKIKKLLRRFPALRSLRLRVMLIIVLTGILPMVITAHSLLRTYEKKVISMRVSEAQTQLRAISNHLISNDYLSNPQNEVISAELSQLASFFDGRILLMNSDLKVVADTYGISVGKSIVAENVVRCLTQDSDGSVEYNREDSYLEVTIPVRENTSLKDTSQQDEASANAPLQERVHGVLLASVSTESMEASIAALGRQTLLVETLIGLIALVASLIISGYLVRPFGQLIDTIMDIRNGYTSQPIRGVWYTETERIVEAFNRVVGRMRQLDESRQEFVANVSHELKTPMTSMKVLADSLLSDPSTPNEMYREFLQDIDNEIDRENKMIDELLNLAKMDQKRAPMNVELVDINALLEYVMKRVRPLAQARGISLTLVSEREVMAEADETKLSMAFTNLIENAVKYNIDHGTVRVTINSDHKNMILTVEDTGIGIPLEAQSRIFERFYRVDKSRSREIGGTGLGLSITRSAVLLHKGTIDVWSEENIGTRFTVTIPLYYHVNPKD